MSEFEVGSEFAGHRIEGVAGRGGMGVVYHATDLALDRAVALKLIAPEYAEDVMFRERFKRESKLAASIKHPNVITVYRAGEEDGLLYVTMDYVSGTDFRELLTRKGRLAPQAAADVVSQVAAGLDAAHARGLVHRDVKPANILLADGDAGHHVYLTDFGLTKQTTSESAITGEGMFVGTLDYIAPEQVQGQPVDARTDVYSLGCVLYEALTGEVPYPRDSDPAKMFAHIGEPAPSVHERSPGVGSEFDAVVRRAMAKDPDERYLSAGDLGRAAVAAAAGQTLTRAERSVATGQAAPPAATRVAGVPPTELAAGAAAAETALAGVINAPETRAAGAAAPPPAATGRRLTPLLIAGGALAVALIVAILVLGGGGDSEPEPASQDSGQQAAEEAHALVGSYAGKVEQFGPGQQSTTYVVEVSIEDLTVGTPGGKISYPKFRCGGNLLVSEAGAEDAVFRERLTSGAKRCYGGGARIAVRRRGTGLTFRWTGDDNGTPIEVLGTLKPVE